MAEPRKQRSGIWFVTRKYPPSVGGMERLSYELTTRIARRRPARILARRGNAPPLPLFILASTVRVAVGALRHQIAVLHLGDPVLAPVGCLAHAMGVPVVVTVHGLDVTYPHPLYRAWLRLFLRGFEAYVCISAAARDAVLARGVGSERTCIIGIGIDPAPRVAIPRETDLLVFVGRIVPRKGLGWFVANVLPRVRQRRPAVRMVAIGDGPDRARAEAAARDAGVASVVQFVGAVGDPEKNAWLARATVCVMPNVPVEGDLEGYGIAALEAAAAACPLVAADIEGLRDAIEHGRGGVLVPAGDTNAWTEALVEWLDHPTTAAAFGEAAREWVLRERGWEGVCDAYERVLETVRR